MPETKTFENASDAQPANGGPRTVPPFHVVLLDDSEHTHEYVVDMICRIFGHPRELAAEMAAEVDSSGRAIVDTTTLERAELKRDQIHGFGADFRVPRCLGSMSAIIQPAGNC